ncbi:hypothetical protein GCM10027422_06460 [Hymenobacter arcticus]
MKSDYKIERTCSNCKFEEQVSVSKREAAFELVNINKILGLKCPRCFEEKFTVSYHLPTLDQELLTEWARDKEIHLMPQDEELLLADEQYLEIILAVLDDSETLVNKKYVLLDAMCVIVYDNSVSDGSVVNLNFDLNLKKRVLEELRKREVLLLQAGDWIMDYIKKVVYPQLTINS